MNDIPFSSVESPISFFESLATDNGIIRLLTPHWSDDPSTSYDLENESIEMVEHTSPVEMHKITKSFKEFISERITLEFKKSKILISRHINLLTSDQEKINFVTYIISELRRYQHVFKDFNVSKKYETFSETLNAIEEFLYYKYPSFCPTNSKGKSVLEVIKRKNTSFEYVVLTKEGQTNITDLLNSLIEAGFIDKSTGLKNFRKIFNGKIITSHIIWTGGISYLSYFIKQLHKNRKVVDTKKKIWEITSSCFKQRDGSSFKRDRLAQQKKPAHFERIDKILKWL